MAVRIAATIGDRMKYQLFPLTVFLLALSTTGQAMTYDFAAEGNRHEAGYSEFNSGDHSVILHGGTPDLPGGLTITASNGRSALSSKARGLYYPGYPLVLVMPGSAAVISLRLVARNVSPVRVAHFNQLSSSRSSKLLRSSTSFSW